MLFHVQCAKLIVLIWMCKGNGYFFFAIPPFGGFFQFGAKKMQMGIYFQHSDTEDTEENSVQQIEIQPFQANETNVSNVVFTAKKQTHLFHLFAC